MNRIAVDVVLLPKERIARLAIEANRRLIGNVADEIVLDETTCLPHLSLAMGAIEASRFSAGRKNALTFEINGENGSITFDLERPSEMEVFWKDDEPKETQGFHRVLVSEPFHPWMENWWPQGHMIGWEHTFIHEITHMLNCIVNDKEVAPYGADFEDGYRCAVICDAILESAATKRQVDCKYE